MADDLAPIDTSWANNYVQPTPVGDPGSAPSGDIAPIDTSWSNSYRQPDPSLQAIDTSYAHKIAPSGTTSNPTPGSLGSKVGGALKYLGLGGGDTSNLGLARMVLPLLSAYGQYKEAKFKSQLPPLKQFAPPPGFSMPGMGGSQFGPPGGYNYQNYAKTGAPGTGYAPVSPAKPPPSYYTYGQGPEQQFFQQVNPNGGPISPVTQRAKGGSVKRFDEGGCTSTANAATNAPQQGALGGMNVSTPMPQPSKPPPAQSGLTGNQGNMALLGGQDHNPYTSGGPGGPSPFGGGQPSQPLMGAPPNDQIHDQSGAGPLPSQPMMGAPPNGQNHNAWDMGPTLTQAGNAGPQPPSTSFGGSPGYLGPRPVQPGALSRFGGGGFRFGGFNNRMQGFAAGGTTQGPAAPTVSRHVTGPGDGTSDSIPARLANGEFVVSADVVSALGNGSNDAGAKKLDAFMSNLRKHKATGMAKGTLPPDARPMDSYMGRK